MKSKSLLISSKLKTVLWETYYMLPTLHLGERWSEIDQFPKVKKTKGVLESRFSFCPMKTNFLLYHGELKCKYSDKTK